MQKIFQKFNLFWLLLSLLALSISGFYSIFVSMMRIPVIYKLFPYPDFFKISLVIHVTLSINIWFILFIFLIWQQKLQNSLISKLVQYINLIAIFLITISGFIPQTQALTINYIPVLNNVYFLGGLALFLANLLVFSIFYAWKKFVGNLSSIYRNIFDHLSFFILFSILISFICLIFAIVKNYNILDLEQIFWGFGHVIQFSFVELALFCMFKNLFVYQRIFDLNIEDIVKANLLKYVSLFKLIVLIIAPFLYCFSNDDLYFTLHMRYAMLVFLLPLPMYLVVKYGVKLLQLTCNYAVLSVIFGFLLSIYGGMTGYFIREVNVTTPAHYHGSLIGLTIIIMGFFYGYLQNICNEYGVKIFKNYVTKIINIQAYLYSIGHFMHILGLILMGGYGALRKTPGDISNSIKMAKYIFFTGSLSSIIGGMIFIILGFYLIWRISKIRNYEI